MQNDPFEQIRRVQKMLNQFTKPVKDVNWMIRSTMAPALEQYTRIQQTLEPTLRFIQQQQDALNFAMKLAGSESVLLQIQKIQEVLQQMTSIPKIDLPVPEIIYPKLEQLLDKVHSVFPDEEDPDSVENTSDISAEKSQIQNKKLDWAQLFNLLVMLIQLLFDYQSGIQSERFHLEQMEQAERHHLEKLAHDERQQKELIELEERQHRELIEQKERHHQEMMNALADFIEDLAPHLPSDQDIAESDSNDLESLE